MDYVIIKNAQLNDFLCNFLNNLCTSFKWIGNLRVLWVTNKKNFYNQLVVSHVRS